MAGREYTDAKTDKWVLLVLEISLQMRVLESNQRVKKMAKEEVMIQSTLLADVLRRPREAINIIREEHSITDSLPSTSFLQTDQKSRRYIVVPSPEYSAEGKGGKFPGWCKNASYKN